jgi:hypothetical protein
MSGLQGQSAPDPSPRKPIIKASLGGLQLRVATAISSRCRRIATRCLKQDPECSVSKLGCVRRPGMTRFKESSPVFASRDRFSYASAPEVE